jgi:hypothetical protein
MSVTLRRTPQRPPLLRYETCLQQFKAFITLTELVLDMCLYLLLFL